MIDRVLPLHLANHARLLHTLGEEDRRTLETILTALLEWNGDTPGHKSD
ncbi:hypothetical protein ACIBKY_04535 [Nonomuraea sp. NPDC050394]